MYAIVKKIVISLKLQWYVNIVDEKSPRKKMCNCMQIRALLITRYIRRVRRNGLSDFCGKFFKKQYVIWKKIVFINNVLCKIFKVIIQKSCRPNDGFDTSDTHMESFSEGFNNSRQHISYGTLAIYLRMTSLDPSKVRERCLKALALSYPNKR